MTESREMQAEAASDPFRGFQTLMPYRVREILLVSSPYDFFTIEQEGQLPAGFEVPLNHYSIPENRVAVVLHLNQPVSPLSTNINSNLLSIEYFDGDWKPIVTQVELIENCSETGAA